MRRRVSPVVFELLVLLVQRCLDRHFLCQSFLFIVIVIVVIIIVFILHSICILLLRRSRFIEERCAKEVRAARVLHREWIRLALLSQALLFRLFLCPDALFTSSLLCLTLSKLCCPPRIVLQHTHCFDAAC